MKNNKLNLMINMKKKNSLKWKTHSNEKLNKSNFDLTMNQQIVDDVKFWKCEEEKYLTRRKKI